uniref:Ig-like domain-containing protein n=1 Tax=Sphaeramia orbicularis TaxID=375764 RepID=A0A673A2D7_9TELE
SVTFVIVFSLFCVSGVLSADFQIFFPETIEAVAGSCVTIPCSFELQDYHRTNLDNTCVIFFIYFGHIIYLKSCLFGDWSICDFPPADPPKPTLSPSELEVEEGASVSLQCSAPAPCPSLRPTVTWTPSLGTSQETLMENQDKTKVIKSVLNFTASHLHHGQRFSCTAVYRREDNRDVSSVSEELTARVKYRPKNTTFLVSPSGSVQEGTNVVLKCSSDANPAVQIYTWYRADPQHETLIHTGPDLTITASRNTGAFLCQAENDLGTERVQSAMCGNTRVLHTFFLFTIFIIFLTNFLWRLNKRKCKGQFLIEDKNSKILESMIINYLNVDFSFFSVVSQKHI